MYIVLFLHQTTTVFYLGKKPYLLYIVLFLHQTTTSRRRKQITKCCISYYSYIKPQPAGINDNFMDVVYRTIPTSNHNAHYLQEDQAPVVYRTIPTSNHNCQPLHRNRHWVVYRTIPTSNHNFVLIRAFALVLYIVLFLHQTTTTIRCCPLRYWLYIVLFLHQTTTLAPCALICLRCISYYSYIKPQPH